MKHFLKNIAAIVLLASLASLPTLSQAQVIVDSGQGLSCLWLIAKQSENDRGQTPILFS